MNKQLRVSIVIPVYNEAGYIADCLRSVMAQTVAATEIIVVNNNSTDDTAKIVAQFPAVRLLHEPKQGVVHARNRGFNAARGEIIGRIDADSRLGVNWIANVQQLFGANNNLGAVTGRVSYENVALSRLISRLDLGFRRYFARTLGDEIALQGANMALRRNVWQQVAATTCAVAGQHEDFDIAIHINHADWEVRFDERLQAAVSYRQGAYNFTSFVSYALTSPRTYRQHQLRSRMYMYPVVWLVISCYLPIKVLAALGEAKRHNATNPAAYMTATLRVNPATFVK